MSTTYKKLQVTKKSTDPKEALSLVEATKPTTLKEGQVLVKVLYAGCNATDLNQFMGYYNPPGVDVPFECGFEGLVQVEQVGEKVPENVKVGGICLALGLGFYAEYAVVDAKTLVPIPAADPKFLTIPISAMTAAVALGEEGGRKGNGPSEDDVVVVTAASGGTGQFAVQLAKKVYKCKTVVGTCSSDEKAEFLKKLGCDIVVNYKKENLGDVLKKNFPQGVDVVYECIGGEMFEQCLQNLGKFGRLISIGSIVNYKSGNPWKRTEDAEPIQSVLMRTSGRFVGFMLPDHISVWPQYMPNLIKMIATGELVAHVDETAKFEGVEKCGDAVSHLHSGKSFGKVVVKIQ